MDYMEVYKYWLSSPSVDDETKAELEALKDNETEIKERFYKELDFGTAGSLRRYKKRGCAGC